MTSILFSIAVAASIMMAIISLSYLISCLWEKESRSALYAGLQFLLVLGLAILLFYLKATGFFEAATGRAVLILGLILSCGILVLLSLKIGSNPKALQGSRGMMVGSVRRYDERDIVFARNRTIRPGTEQYKTYYELRPEYEQFDAARRKRGGPLGKPGTVDKPKDRPNVAATLASLSIPLHLATPEKFNPSAHPEFNEQRVEISSESASARIKGYALSIGADLVGITEINPLWIYANRGEIFHDNWEDWGRPVELTHRYAVVFATEMAFELVGTAPHTPTTIASMANYARGAFIATQLAAYIANLGYSATANHLRHYDAVLVPLAVDAGLGQTGRLGYLMTKNLGPRVRLGAVTTDLPLIADKPVDIGVEDFCRICKKCANCCPSNSIPRDDQKEFNGTLRWKLNAETCFDYWGKVGTDCNICMRVCPWSHANTFPHKLIRALITRNRYARRLFNLMDDIFYGKKPRPKPAPEWACYE
ncbi:MAG: reductive dehalogenase [Deltaproteobacteria bacterium]|jgi:NAD-dependent dihydropyrimidine dehydrogenase PreA subunit|nr:reductive dehalogenase [Deltaproteobacteria bacterium]